MSIEARTYEFEEESPIGQPSPVAPETMTSEITLLAFDPGGTTGFMLGTFNPKSGQIIPGSVQFGEVGPNPHHKELWRIMQETGIAYPQLMIVTEDYIPEFGRAQNYVALEYIGVMTAFGNLTLVSIERQSRNIKTYWTKEKMMSVGVWPRGKKHAQDAARHWLTYASKISRPLNLNLARAMRYAGE